MTCPQRTSNHRPLTSPTRTQRTQLDTTQLGGKIYRERPDDPSLAGLYKLPENSTLHSVYSQQQFSAVDKDSTEPPDPDLKRIRECLK